MTWKCKKHGKECLSYCCGIVIELNANSITPETIKKRQFYKQEIKLVEWVKEND